MVSMDKLLFDYAVKHDPDFVVKMILFKDGQRVSSGDSVQSELIHREQNQSKPIHHEQTQTKPLTYIERKQILYEQFWMITTMNTDEELTWPFTCLTEQEAWDSIKSFGLNRSSCRAFFVDMESFETNNAKMLRYHALRKKEQGL